MEKDYASVFSPEEAAERALPGMYLERKRRAAFNHDLIELAEELGAPENALRAAAELSPDYLRTRYPARCLALSAAVE